MSAKSYALTVYEDRGERTGLFDIRVVTLTLKAAKAFADAETQLFGIALNWKDQFGGSIAHAMGLAYDIRPTRSESR